MASGAGVDFALSQRLTGALALGYLSRVYRDPTLPDVRGPAVDGSLLFILTPLTSVKLTATSTIDASVLAGVSGLLRRDGGLSRAVQLKGELQEVWLCSNKPHQNYAASVAMIGLRYQR